MITAALPTNQSTRTLSSLGQHLCQVNRPLPAHPLVNLSSARKDQRLPCDRFPRRWNGSRIHPDAIVNISLTHLWNGRLQRSPS
jgi:hypothetical protein